MELIRIGKKGQVSIPRKLLEAAGLGPESQVLVEVADDGGLRLRPAAVYPIERYSDARIAEFESENRVSDELRQRAGRLTGRDQGDS